MVGEHLDTERLFTNVDNIYNRMPHVRGEGRTFAYLTIMYGKARRQSTPSRFVHVSSAHASATHACNLFKDMLDASDRKNVIHTAENRVVLSTGPMFEFVGINKLVSAGFVQQRPILHVCLDVDVTQLPVFVVPQLNTTVAMIHHRGGIVI